MRTTNEPVNAQMTAHPYVGAMSETTTGDVIWRRTIDHEATDRRRKRFLQWYCLPVALLTLVFGVVAGPWEALGVLILFGGFGLLLGAWIFLHGRNLGTNPTIVLDHGSLRVGKTEIPVAAVQRWTTYPREVSMSTTTAHGLSRWATSSRWCGDGARNTDRDHRSRHVPGVVR